MMNSTGFLLVIVLVAFATWIIWYYTQNVEEKKKKEKEVDPIIGRTYVFRPTNNGNPFANLNEHTHKVIVLDVKDGWVLYDWVDNSIWKNQSTQIHSFNYMYCLEEN